MSVVARQAVGLLVLSAGFIALILQLSRSRRLSYRYTLGWLFFGLLVGLSVVPLLALESLSEFLGVPPLNVGLLVLGVVVLGVAVELSLSTSHLSRRQRELGMHQALASAVGSSDSARGQAEVLVVIPALNEEATVGSVILDCIGEGFDCLVINDGSSDRTADIALNHGAVVLTAPFNLGIGVALRAGFIWAVRNGYQTVVQCDADGQHSPASIARLVQKQRDSNAHLVIGSRFAEDNNYRVGLLRSLMMRWLARRASEATGSPMTDASSGFRCIHGDLLEEFAREYPADYMDSYEALVAAGSAGYRVSEVFTEMRERTSGSPSNGPLKAAFHTAKVLTAGIAGTRVRYRRYQP